MQLMQSQKLINRAFLFFIYFSDIYFLICSHRARSR